MFFVELARSAGTADTVPDLFVPTIDCSPPEAQVLRETIAPLVGQRAASDSPPVPKGVDATVVVLFS